MAGVRGTGVLDQSWVIWCINGFAYIHSADPIGLFGNRQFPPFFADNWVCTLFSYNWLSPKKQGRCCKDGKSKQHDMELWMEGRAGVLGITEEATKFESDGPSFPLYTSAPCMAAECMAKGRIVCPFGQ